VLLVVPLAVLWLARGERRPRDAAWIAVVPLGLAAFCAASRLAAATRSRPSTRRTSGSATSPGRSSACGTARPPRGALCTTSATRRRARTSCCSASSCSRCPAVVGTLRRLPPAYGAYVVAALALPLSYPVGPQPLMSLPRFLAVLFPLFMWLGAWLADGGRGAAGRGARAVGGRARRGQRRRRDLALVRMKAALLDALGTLVELERPWPHLVARAARPRRVGARGGAERAMLAEMAYYQRNHDDARTSPA
jgi:hypothetical protein